MCQPYLYTNPFNNISKFHINKFHVQIWLEQINAIIATFSNTQTIFVTGCLKSTREIRSRSNPINPDLNRPDRDIRREQTQSRIRDLNTWRVYSSGAAHERATLSRISANFPTGKLCVKISGPQTARYLACRIIRRGGRMGGGRLQAPIFVC